ncbi:MAG: hypothetical protein QXX68_00505 [Candidatus Pacearchaeota archaeon]
MANGKVFIRIERQDYIDLKKEVLGILMDVLTIKKKVNNLFLIRRKKRELKKILREKFEKVDYSMNTIISSMPREALKKNFGISEKKKKQLRKKESTEPIEKPVNKDNIEEELFLIKKKIEELSSR